MNLRRRFLLLVCTSLLVSHSFCAHWTVNPGTEFGSPNALYLADQAGDIEIEDGDSIYIYETPYFGTETLAAWQQNNLYIYSNGSGAELFADGAYILGKGIWVLAGDNITVDNILFTEAAVPDENGAGIRLDGIGMTIKNCIFVDNENGILIGNTYDGDVLVENTHFNHNGFGDGFTHNIYVGHINSFTMRYCRSERADVGHNVKSRANVNTIVYNLIIDGETGNSSRLIDIPNGGKCIIMGNSLMQGPMALNNNLVGYGLEGLSNPAPHDFYFIFNTCVNKREASCLFLDVEEGTNEVYIANNVFAGTGTVISDEFTFYANNYENESIDECLFANEGDYDFQLLFESPLIDGGIELSAELTPIFQYKLDLDYDNRITEGVSPDIGAYEFIPLVSINTVEELVISIYPNPSNGLIQIKSNAQIDVIEVLTINGAILRRFSHPEQSIDLSEYESGIYFIRVHSNDEVIVKRLVLRE